MVQGGPENGGLVQITTPAVQSCYVYVKYTSTILIALLPQCCKCSLQYHYVSLLGVSVIFSITVFSVTYNVYLLAIGILFYNDILCKLK